MERGGDGGAVMEIVMLWTHSVSHSGVEIEVEIAGDGDSQSHGGGGVK